MKRIFCIVIAVVLWASIGCKNSNNNQQSNTVVDTVPFYPINSFVIEEIRKAKDSSYTISKKTIVNRGKADSVQISNEDFAQLAQIFLKKDISLAPLKAKYKESVFRDLTTNSTIMNYNTTDGNEEIQGIDLIVNTDNSIRRIDWRAFVTRNDSTFKENYSWLPNKQFNIVRTYEGTATKPHIEEVYVYWNKK